MTRSFKAFIVISALLNLLMAAIIAGHMGRYLVGPHYDRDAQEIASALPENKLGLFTETMNRAEDDNGELHEQLSEARKQAANILKAEPFEKQNYLAQLRKIHDLRGKLMLRNGETISGLAEQFTPEERAILADNILNHHEAIWHNHKSPPAPESPKP